MKKYILIVMVTILMLTSCATKSPYLSDHPEYTEDGAPYWTVLTPIDKYRYYGVGMGQLSNQINSKMKAEAAARDDIARQVSVLINTAVKNYTNEAGMVNNTQELSAFETISLQVVNTTLRNIIIENLYQDPETDAIWVIASYEKKYLKDAYQAEAENVKRSLEKRKIAAVEALAKAEERNAAAIEQINLSNLENKDDQLEALAKAYSTVVDEKNKEIANLEAENDAIQIEKMVDALSVLLEEE
ncbi:MAG: LPP20 family lipoprotein [Pleomorphochaeta sp.]